MDCMAANGSAYVGDVECNLKMISRGQSVITFTVDITKALDFINVNFAVVWKSSSNTFSNTIINGTFELCKALGSMPAMLKLIMPLVSKHSPNLIHACPYFGLLPLNSIKSTISLRFKAVLGPTGVTNFPIDIDMVPVIALGTFQRGEYRIDASYYDRNKEYIAWVKIYVTVAAKRYSKKKDKNDEAP